MATKPCFRCGAVMAAVTAMTLMSVARTAQAADWFTLLDWACNKNATNEAAVKAMVLTACRATEGAKTACDVVAGTPFACFDKQSVGRDNTSCDSAGLTFTVNTDTAQTFGWKVEGTLTVAASYSLFWKTAQECSLTAKVPVPTAQGGDYIFKAGTAKAFTVMNAGGTGRITFLGGTVFSETVTKQCSQSLTVSAYKPATAAACMGTPTPTPAPTSSPTGTPAPTPIATATPPSTTPTPGGTPPATPPPVTPTASATPPPVTPTASVTPVATAVPTAAAR